MARINTVNPTAATGKTKTLLDAVQAKLGVTPNMMKTMAHSPAALEGYLSFSGALGHGELNVKVREQIALRVAEVNDCEYCVAAHSVIGKGAGLSDAEVNSARRGEAPDAKAAAAVKFAERIIATNGAVDDRDVSEARAAGLSDAALAEIVAVVSLNIYTNLFNKVFDVEVDFPRAPALAGR